MKLFRFSRFKPTPEPTRRYFDSGLLNEATDLHLLLKEIEAQKPPENGSDG